jgi:ABC-type antimicrobial peptide transport system permease subunit
MLKRITNKLKQRKKTYSLIVLQFAVGFFLLNLFICTSVSINNKHKTLLREGKSKEFTITAEYKDANFFNRAKFDILEWGKGEPVLRENDKLPFDSQDLQRLHDKFSNADFNMTALVYISYLFGEGAEYKICYSSDYNEVEATPGFLKMLKDMNHQTTVNPRDFPHTLLKDEFTSINGLKYSVKEIDKEVNEIYIPIDCYYDLYHPKDLFNISMNIKINDDKVNYSGLQNEVLNLLNENHGDIFAYSLGSEFVNFLRLSNRAGEEAMAFNFIAAVLLLIVLIGLSGLFVLIINRRKREIAISLALGATKGRVYMECLLEMSILAVTGSVIGILASVILLSKGFESAAVVTYPNMLVSLTLTGLSLLVAIISTIPVFITIKKLMPIEILRTV